jgi:hypothetical protein
MIHGEAAKTKTKRPGWRWHNMSSFSARHYPEPLLEFGGNGRHVDVRFGLMDFGPVDFATNQTKEIRLGIVGSAQAVGKLGDWLGRCETGIAAKNSRQPNLFPGFPGSTILGPFRCGFVVNDQDVRTIPASMIARITSEKNDEIATRLAVTALRPARILIREGALRRAP